MKKYGDTGQDLSNHIGISRATLSSKMNEYRGAEFTQGEMQRIIEKYKLTARDIEDIFFTRLVSWKDTLKGGKNGE